MAASEFRYRDHTIHTNPLSGYMWVSRDGKVLTVAHSEENAKRKIDEIIGDAEPLIKVHVTKEQRGELEFLVNRRLGEIDNYERTTGKKLADPIEKEVLKELKLELRHAGT